MGGKRIWRQREKRACISCRPMALFDRDIFPQQSGSRSYIALADTRYKSTCELYVSALKAHDCALFGAACGENEISSSSFFSFFFFVIWFCYYRRYMNYCMYDVPHFSPGHVYTRYSVITIMDATVHRRRLLSSRASGNSDHAEDAPLHSPFDG